MDGKHLCSLGHSPHQIIYNLYNVIALTEIKGYAMIQFAYMIMRLHGEGNFTIGIKIYLLLYLVKINMINNSIFIELLFLILQSQKWPDKNLNPKPLKNYWQSNQFYPGCPENIGNVTQINM